MGGGGGGGEGENPYPLPLSTPATQAIEKLDIIGLPA